MKKLCPIIFALIILLTFSACGNSTANRTSKNNTKTVADILNDATDNSSANKNDIENSSKEENTQNIKCDIDLTSINTNMVYAEVSNMMSSPDQYIGKTVKMKGAFSVYETDARNYYACIIADATACCSKGIEFVLKDACKYPDEYPKEGTEITVSGKFETYLEGEYRYCQLSDAVLVK